MKIFPLVLAHTGDDSINHQIETADGIFLIIIIAIILFSIYLIKKYKKKKCNTTKR